MISGIQTVTDPMDSRQMEEALGGFRSEIQSSTPLDEKLPDEGWEAVDAIPLRTTRSLPNVQDDSGTMGPTSRERCNTNIVNSKPIRIPGTTTDEVPEEPPSNQNSRSGPVQIVTCDDIVIHFDRFHSPATESPTTNTSSANRFAGQTRSCIGSAPPDFLTSEFIPSRGEKIPRPSRHRHLSTGLEDLAISPSHGVTASHIVSSPLQRPRRGQTLISFLQGFSPSDNELERENAHFTVCESVICALEQLKWKKRREKQHKAQSPVEDVAPKWPLRSPSPSDEECLFETSGTDISDSQEWTSTNSAEAIGVKLLSNFKDLPEAIDIPWLTFDKGFLSNSCCTLSSGDSWPKASFCRGNNEWAPARPQIIFNKRVVRNTRKKVLQEQDYRCRGCGLRVSLEYSNTFRLCSYTGDYFCTACHRNQMSVIPGHVFMQWDFKLYPVSVVAYRLLSDIWFSPLFQIETINTSLYKKVPLLKEAQLLRGYLKHAKDHLAMCRFFQQPDSDIFKLPDYMTMDVDLWSMADLKAVERGDYNQYVAQFIKMCDDHVVGCELCLARGYLCEVCHGSDILFPWRNRVVRCTGCGSCSHLRCWSGKCKKCARIKQRKRYSDDNNDLTTKPNRGRRRPRGGK